MRCAVVLCISALVFVSCKKKEEFTEPRYVMGKWSRAIEKLDYHGYRDCEAFPKSEGVFRELYRLSYFSDILITEIKDLDNKKILKDDDDHSYLKRTIIFECTELNRKTHRAMTVLHGEVDFIRYLDGKRASDGWLMWNRKLIRSGK